MDFTSYCLNTQKGKETFLWEDPWKVLDAHSYALGLHKTPQKKVGPCNAARGAWGGAARRIPARPTAGMAGEG
jgi:hypothetical protein